MSEGLRAKAPDGRVVAYEISGAPEGWPVFLLHGTPGSRRGPKPRVSVLYRLGVRLITHDRPGYGDSDRQEKRRVCDVANDIELIADELGLREFSVVGRSGGGPHALACAALMPERVTRTAVLVGFAPPDAPGLAWYEGMSSTNSNEFATAGSDAEAMLETMRLRADRALRNPETFIDFLRHQMSRADQEASKAVMMRRLFAETYREAFKSGPYGWLDDDVALRGNWGFELKTIESQVRLWHGTDDTFAPVEHTHWLGSQLPHAEVLVQEGAAHFDAVEILPVMLGWLAGGRSAPQREREKHQKHSTVLRLAAG